ncbi:hypothetical protein MKUB_05450 [Mycobacterium kubicae]|uniref:DUF732 domain-containing protein n=1 Tax=Mycobacterium kubicae TaxID=120959 RepID=A0AAX1JEQ1_9MYCO|nr:DUF732 domain-containing protein [Mycobacterium kubicae]MCV7096722.1 DUF732 domain-containing protein [Mycobacterium kubicae]OBK47247.1 hypothetical protein A5657_24960 [Mycobacterium kubicae]ORW01602.1 hypothetical protein AWC13_07415 [Mycobacterium kubicae]QNI05853.1 DUF732 domain-containing protein [Mycobacterium kubicae]QNI10847.1 DUF732 domain-containing protein [Mycobacterium kubicae]
MNAWRHQPLTIRLLAASAGALAAAAALAAPAEASPIDDQFLGALNNAGVNYGDAGNAAALGQTVCPMLAQPGGNFAAAASRVGGNGMSPGMASMFTSIAIQMYCPQMMSDIASGNIGALQQLPGVSMVPGLAGGGMPGLPGGIPGF